MNDKIQAIEDFDQRIVKAVLDKLLQRNEEFRMVVTMDHYTPLSLRTHTSDPVPTLLYDSRETGKGCGLPFSEKACIASQTQGATSLPYGYTLMDKLFRRC